MPLVSLTLTHEQKRLTQLALVDSGSTINVLPYHLGLELGLVWETQTIALNMKGILASEPAFAVVVTGELVDLSPSLLIFAWTRKSDVRLILGQTNFFQAFDVCFSGSQQVFDIAPKGTLIQTT